MVDRYGDHFESIELWNEPNNLLDWDWRVDTDWHKYCTMIGAAAHWARERGKMVVLGGPCPNDLNWLRLLGERGVFGVVDAIGLHGFPGTWDSEEGVWPGWKRLCADVRKLLNHHNPDAAIWLTEAGYSTWRHDGGEQVRRFLEAFEAPVERVYWYALQDLADNVSVQEGHRFDDRHYHLGLYEKDGRPKLLARLLAQKAPVEAARKLLDLTRSPPAAGGARPVLISGGAGFIGSNLADSLCTNGERVHIVDALTRDGVEQNLEWLKQRHGDKLSITLGDVRDSQTVADAAADAGAVFHLAAQVAVTSSLTDPRFDFENNLLGTLNILEAARKRSFAIPVIFASTNKVYGDLSDVALKRNEQAYRPVDPVLRSHGIPESRPISFHTPYGCSKGAADQYVLDYARTYGVPAAVMRMSCIYGPRQFGTEDQGWVAHFLIRALTGEPITIFGDGHQVRDILYVDDAVSAYVAAWRQISAVSGEAFNLGGGPRNAVSLRQILRSIESIVGSSLHVRFEDWRPGDQLYYVSDNRRVRSALKLDEPLPWQKGLVRLADWLKAQKHISRRPSVVTEWTASEQAIEVV